MESFIRDVAPKLLRARRDGSLFPPRAEELTNNLPRPGGQGSVGGKGAR